MGSTINNELWVAVEKEFSNVAVGACGDCGRITGGDTTLVSQRLCTSHLEFSTVTLLSLLHVAVATFLPTIEDLDLRHVEQTHADTLFKAGCQVLLAAAAEHRRERIPVSDGNIW